MAAQDLIMALHNRHQTAPINKAPKHMAALQQLAQIFAEAAGTTNDEYNGPLRVNKESSQTTTTAPSTSQNATSLMVIAKQPRVHQQQTRANNPMPTIFENSSQDLQHISTRGEQLNVPRPTIPP